MFYHDHAWGITRLNVLSGEAAGLLLTDPTEQDLTFGPNAVLPGYGIPLVIQDRTFVNAAMNPLSSLPRTAGTSFVRETDPTWNFGSGTPDAQGIRPPVTGDFWIPHVYVRGPEPVHPERRERVRPLGLRPVVLPAHREPHLPAGPEPLPRRELQRPGSGGAGLLHHAEPAARHPGHAAPRRSAPRPSSTPPS